jgi:hypothetical protein
MSLCERSFTALAKHKACHKSSFSLGSVSLHIALQARLVNPLAAAADCLRAKPSQARQFQRNVIHEKLLLHFC